MFNGRGVASQTRGSIDDRPGGAALRRCEQSIRRGHIFSRRVCISQTAHRLQEELQRAREEIQTTNEELQSSNEELETTNEELQSSNEELETTNEELETMNEELQSTNEELHTVNEELRQRTDEVNRANAFLQSIVSSLRSGAVVIDQHFNILVWNHRALVTKSSDPKKTRGGACQK